MSLVFLATTPLVLALFRRNGKKPDAVLSPLEKTAAAARGGLDVKVAFDDDADAEDDARDDDDDDDALLFPAKRRKGGWCCFGPLILSILLLKKAALLVALLLEKIVVVVVVVVVVIIAAFVRVRAFVDTTTRKRVVLYNVCEWNIIHLSIQSHFFKRKGKEIQTLNI